MKVVTIYQIGKIELKGRFTDQFSVHGSIDVHNCNQLVALLILYHINNVADNAHMGFPDQDITGLSVEEEVYSMFLFIQMSLCLAVCLLPCTCSDFELFFNI